MFVSMISGLSGLVASSAAVGRGNGHWQRGGNQRRLHEAPPVERMK